MRPLPEEKEGLRRLGSDARPALQVGGLARTGRMLHTHRRRQRRRRRRWRRRRKSTSCSFNPPLQPSPSMRFPTVFERLAHLSPLSHSSAVAPSAQEGIVGLSYQYKDEGGNMVHISRGKVRTPCDSSCARFPGTVSPCPLDLVVGERDVSSRATVDREGRTYAEPRFESPLRRGSDSLLHIARCCNLCSRCTLRRDASLSTA